MFYVLATSKVISGPVPACDSAHSWWLYSAARLGNQVTSTMTWYPPQSHYPDTVWHQSMPYPNNSECLARKRQVSIVKSLVWFNQSSNPRGSDSMISQSRRWMLYSSCLAILSGPYRFNLCPLATMYNEHSRTWNRIPQILYMSAEVMSNYAFIFILFCLIGCRVCFRSGHSPCRLWHE